MGTQWNESFSNQTRVWKKEIMTFRKSGGSAQPSVTKSVVSMPASGLHSRTVECKPCSCSGKVNTMGMSNKLGFMQQLPWPPHPTENVKVHACWVAQVDLKKKKEFSLPSLQPHCVRTHTGRKCSTSTTGNNPTQ